MFKNLLSFWKGKDFLLQVMEDFKVMLDDAESMFEAVCARLAGGGDDAERPGDYSKNLYEVTELLEHPIDKSLFSQYFDSLDGDIVKLFGQTKDAFIDADEEKARSTWDYHRRINKACDKIVKEVAKSDLSVNEAVCFALVARHFKRIVSHLVNIATSVVLPLSDLDYFDEKRSKQ